MYPNLNAEMKRENKFHTDLAALLNLNISSISDKMTGKRDFKLKECKKIRDCFFPKMTIDYLFSLEKQNLEE